MNFKKNLFALLLIINLITLLVSRIKAQAENTNESVEAKEYQQTAEEKARGEFSSQWEREMSDYEPDFVYMIPLDYKSSDVFYQNITNIQNFKLRGAILVDEDKKESIDFRIESPSGIIVYKNTTAQCIFNIELKEKGVYKFYFDNKYENSEIRITFTLNSGNNNVVKKTDLDFSQQKANSLLEFIEKIKTERKLKKNSEYVRSLSNILNKNYYYFNNFSFHYFYFKSLFRIGEIQ